MCLFIAAMRVKGPRPLRKVNLPIQIPILIVLKLLKRDIPRVPRPSLILSIKHLALVVLVLKVLSLWYV